MMEKLGCKNDAALARKLEVAPPVISKIRHRRLPIGASLLVMMHELTGEPVAELRAIMGDRRKSYRLSTVPNHPKRADVIAAKQAEQSQSQQSAQTASNASDWNKYAVAA
jgi:hypothetical protein